ncbi:MAG: hypothetical protein ACFFCW_28705, partial [Candidatus Hodarchaeota archaeon]
MTESRRWLEEADPLELELTLNDETKGSVEYLLKDLKIADSYHHLTEEKRIEALKCVLANLLAAFHCNMPIRYSRNANHYKATPYSPKWYTYKIMIPILDKLGERGWIHEKKGFRNQDAGVSFETRGIPTAQLVSFFEDHDIGLSSIIYVTTEGREIRFKKLYGDNWREVQYEDNDETRRWRKEVKEYDK